MFAANNLAACLVVAYLLAARATSRPSAAGASLSCPVSLLRAAPAGEEGLQLDEYGLRYLGSLSSPLYLVPMLGVYRGGKSLLLCRLLGLRAPYVGGFGVGHTQETFTRGIEICAEEVSGLGTVVWMDTEGLFSSEEARGAYGPKIFSLALLFSSAVLLNSVKVLNDQFVAFFSEQQQIAKILQQGLASAGLPLETLMPGNLSVFWVLQQPVRFDRSAEASHKQLNSFLSLPEPAVRVPGQTARPCVLCDFQHFVHEVPVAARDIRAWNRLDKLPDEELENSYVTASAELRERVLGDLQWARPLQAVSVVKQIEMYLQVVQTQQFSATLAKEAFEEAEIGGICGNFNDIATRVAGPLPSQSLEDAIAAAGQAVQEKRTDVIESFRFDQRWSARLDTCLQEQITKLEELNALALLAEWQSAATHVAQGSSCFFLGSLAGLLKEFSANHSRAFSSSIRTQTVQFGSALQRTRLAECFQLRDVLKPLLPWFAWPFCIMYLRPGLISGGLTMVLHALVFTTIYMVLNSFHWLPNYFDMNYPVLRVHPLLLEIVMRAPPMFPWQLITRWIGLIGAARSAWKVLRHVKRPSGDDCAVAQLVSLELELNSLLQSTEASCNHRLARTALEAAEHIDSGRVRLAALTLLRGFALARESCADSRFASQLRLQQRSISHLPISSCYSFQEHNLVDCAVSGDTNDLLEEMLKMFSKMMESSPWRKRFDHAVDGSPDFALEHSAQILARGSGSDCSSSESPDSSTDRNSPLSIIECNAGPSAEYCSPGEYCSVSSVDDFSPDPDANRDSLVYASDGSRSDADSSSPISVNGCSPGIFATQCSTVPSAEDCAAVSGSSSALSCSEQSSAISVTDCSPGPIVECCSPISVAKRSHEALTQRGFSAGHGSPVSDTDCRQAPIAENAPAVSICIDHGSPDPGTQDWWTIGSPICRPNPCSRPSSPLSARSSESAVSVTDCRAGPSVECCPTISVTYRSPEPHRKRSFSPDSGAEHGSPLFDLGHSPAPTVRSWYESSPEPDTKDGSPNCRPHNCSRQSSPISVRSGSPEPHTERSFGPDANAEHGSLVSGSGCNPVPTVRSWYNSSQERGTQDDSPSCHPDDCSRQSSPLSVTSGDSAISVTDCSAGPCAERCSQSCVAYRSPEPHTKRSFSPDASAEHASLVSDLVCSPDPTVRSWYNSSQELGTQDDSPSCHPDDCSRRSSPLSVTSGDSAISVTDCSPEPLTTHSFSPDPSAGHGSSVSGSDCKPAPAAEYRSPLSVHNLSPCLEHCSKICAASGDLELGAQDLCSRNSSPQSMRSDDSAISFANCSPGLGPGVGYTISDLHGSPVPVGENRAPEHASEPRSSMDGIDCSSESGSERSASRRVCDTSPFPVAGQITFRRPFSRTTAYIGSGSSPSKGVPTLDYSPDPRAEIVAGGSPGRGVAGRALIAGSSSPISVAGYSADFDGELDVRAEHCSPVSARRHSSTIAVNDCVADVAAEVSPPAAVKDFTRHLAAHLSAMGSVADRGPEAFRQPATPLSHLRREWLEQEHAEEKRFELDSPGDCAMDMDASWIEDDKLRQMVEAWDSRQS